MLICAIVLFTTYIITEDRKYSYQFIPSTLTGKALNSYKQQLCPPLPANVYSQIALLRISSQNTKHSVSGHQVGRGGKEYDSAIAGAETRIGESDI